MDRSVRTDLSEAHREQAVEKRIAGVCGLKAWKRAQISPRIVAHARKRHVDQRAIVCLQRHAQIEVQYAVGPGRHPVAAGNYDTSKALAGERSPDDRIDREIAVRR